MDADHDAIRTATGDGSRRLIRGLTSIAAEPEQSWKGHLDRILALGIDVLGATGAVLTQANEDHHWVVATVGQTGLKPGDRLEPGESRHTLPHERHDVVTSATDGHLGAPVSRRGAPWGSLSFATPPSPVGAVQQATEHLVLIAEWLSRELTLRQSEAELHRSQQHLGHLVHIDPLTELLNRRGATDAFESFVRRSGFEGTPLSYLICGLSGMHRINDRFGRPTGDRVVRAVARSLRGSLRPGDVSARIGRYELLGILPGASLTSARSIAERVLAAIDDLQLATRDGDPVVPTVRIGVARVTLQEGAFDDVLSHVGPLLREANRSGEVAVANGMFPTRQEAG